MSGSKARMGSILFGFAIFLTINAFTIWGGFLPFLPIDTQTTSLLSGFFTMQTAFFCAALLLVGLSTYRFPGLFERKPVAMAIAASVLLFLGTTNLLLYAYFKTYAAVLVPVAGALLGISSAGFFILWQRVFASEKPSVSGPLLMGASALSAVLYMVLFQLPFPLITVGVPIVLVPMGSLFLIKSTRNADFSQPMFTAGPAEHPLTCRHAFSDLWGPALCVASLGFVAGIIRAIAFDDPLTGYLINVVSMAGMFAAAILLLVVWRVSRIQVNLTRWYQIVFPFVATGFLLLPFFGTAYHYVFVGFSYFVFSFASMLMVLTCAQVSRKRTIKPEFIYGLFAGCVYLFSGIGFTVGGISRSVDNFGFTQLSIIALFSVYLLAIILLANRNKVQEVMEHGPQPISVEAEVGKQAESAIVVENDPRDILAIHCSDLAARHSLSNREAEVMELLARGRDVPYIAESLYISQNTVRTHSKNIYCKLDIHTKRELLNLVEGCDAELHGCAGDGSA